MEIVKYTQKNNSFMYLLFLGLFIFFLDILGLIVPARDFLSYISSPIAKVSFEYASNIKRSLAFISSYSDAQRDILVLEKRISQLESQNIGYSTLLDKHNLLLAQSKTSSKNYSYIESGIYTTNTGYGYVIDKGKTDGISVGKIIVLGNVYLGEVVKVDAKSSLIRRPQDVGSSLPITIVRDSQLVNMPTDKLKDNVSKGVKAVAVGRNEQIEIQNIPNNGLVKNGDIVLVSSPDIAGYLVLGTIDQILSDSAASVLSAKVSPIIDIYSIKFVFVRND